MPKALSICIPTYNRAIDVIRTLSDVAEQCTPEVEIVVSNNGSTDDTKVRLEAFKLEHPALSLTIVHQSENIGFDRNVLAVVDAAQGEYVWLLSDDDSILPGGVQRILNLCKQHPAANYVLNFQRFDALQKKITAERMVALHEDIASTDMNAFYFHPLQRPSYFQVLGTNMITMSINVFQRDAWNAVIPNVQSYIGKNFIHIFALLTVMQQQHNAYFVADPIVRYVSNHHRPWANDIWADYKADFLGYLSQLGYNQKLIDRVKKSTINYRTLTERFLPILLFIRKYIPI